MPSHEEKNVSRLLRAVGQDRAGAGDRLFELVYDELKGIAHSKMKGERPGHTLQTTALVNEAYLRLVSGGSPGWKSRGYFFNAAAEAMRRILVERARRVRAAKRGSDPQRVPLDEEPAGIELPADVLELDLALDGLEQHDARKARVVKLRYFVGLTVEETAELLGVSPSTVDKDWRLAKAWLHREIVRGSDGP